MTSIYNIATMKTFKLYGDKYTLIPYNKHDTIDILLYKYRVNNNLSFNDLSKITGYSVSYLCNVENKTINASSKLTTFINDKIKFHFIYNK